MIAVLVVLAVLAYLLGTFPSAVLVARAGGHDVLREGSGNPGASNVFRVLGWKAGLAVFALDVVKGALAAGLGLAVSGRLGALVVGIAAVMGHVFPVTRRFRGGRGVATAGGLVLVVYPLIFGVLIVGWILVGFGLRRASVASLLVAVALPVLVALRGYGRQEVVLTGVLAVLILVRHAPNLRRLVRGGEPALHWECAPIGAYSSRGH